MRIKISSTPAPKDPVLFDKTFLDIQGVLKDKLDWLNIAFGKCQDLRVRREDGAVRTYPAFSLPRSRDNKYISLFPSSELGNYSFFRLLDPQETVDFSRGQQYRVRAPFDLIFWFNIKTALGDNEESRSIEKIKREIINVLVNDLVIMSGRIQINSIFEENRNIFNGYTIPEEGYQHLMHPYGGLKLSGVVESFDLCGIDTSPFISREDIFISDTIFIS